MPGAREIGLVGAALALTGGVACAVCYLRRKHGRKTREPEKTEREGLNEDGSRGEHVHKAIKTDSALKAPVISEVCGFDPVLSSQIVF